MSSDRVRPLAFVVNPFAFPGFSIHHELELTVEAGFPPMEALRAATRRAAEMMNRQVVFGSIERVKRADLLLLAAASSGLTGAAVSQGPDVQHEAS